MQSETLTSGVRIEILSYSCEIPLNPKSSRYSQET